MAKAKNKPTEIGIMANFPSTNTINAAGKPGKASANGLTRQQLVDVYKKMLQMRLFEETAYRYYRQGYIGGFFHTYIGQEAVLAGCDLAMLPDDKIVTSYRCHAHAFFRSGTEGMKTGMAELFGRGTGSSKGKGGSMHMFDIKNGYFGGHGIVGAQVPIGTGIAFANKYNNTKNVCLAMMGDGAANQGQVYESFNMAALWKLPVIYIIENNLYAMGTSTKRACANHTTMYQRGMGFGIPGYQVDGMNLFSCHKIMTEAIALAREGQPVLVEFLTYRFKTHSMSDPGKYRSKEEVENMVDNHDPIINLKKFLLSVESCKSNGLTPCTQDEIDKIQEECEADVEASIQFALNSPEPDLSELYTDITS